MTPKKTAAPFLWFSFCFGNVLEAVVLGSVQYPDNGLHSHLDARGPAEASASSRNDSTSVHVPSYMISLYRTLSELDRRASNSSQTRSRRYANTVTSFMDLGQEEPSLKFHQQYTFDLSGLSRLDELMEVELRVLRRPLPDVLSLLSSGGNLYRLLLHTCSLPGSSNQPLLLNSRIIDLLDTASATWDVFDVGASVKTHLKFFRTAEGSRPLCFSISAISDSDNKVVHPGMLGLCHEDQQTHERALLVTFTRARRKENLFREIHEKIKAMKNRKFPNSAPEHGIKGHPRHRRRRRTALAGRSGAGPATGGAGGGKGGGRRRTRALSFFLRSLEQKIKETWAYTESPDSQKEGETDQLEIFILRLLSRSATRCDILVLKKTDFKSAEQFGVEGPRGDACLTICVELYQNLSLISKGIAHPKMKTLSSFSDLQEKF
uniref:Growth differentiation factor 7 n=1 Tax=Cyprinus carpio TaxID=7962 RepID=A0A8C2CEK6_CYPCA